MKIYRCLLAGVVAGISALAVSSCAYDPYYSGSSYSSGGSYGDGYGYGNSSFSTSFFVTTGNPRWGYDPYAGAYYDYTRHCYYDPYLSGYYPRGYRPRYVTGSPHPHGWARGRSSIAPPSRVRSYNLTNYQNRGERYRGLGRDWSSNVRISTPGRDQRSGPSRDQRSSYSGRGSSQGSIFGSDRGSSRGNVYGGDRGSSQGRTYGGNTRGQTSVPQQRPERRPAPQAAPSNNRGGFSNPSPAAPQRSTGVFGRGGKVMPQPQPQAQPPRQTAPQGDDRGSRGGSRGSGGGENRSRGGRSLGQG